MLVDHDPLSGIEPWMGEIDPLRPPLRNGEIGDGNVDLAVCGGVDQGTDRRELAVLALQTLRCRDRLPEFDRHPGEPAFFLHDEWRAQIEADADWLFGLRRFLRKWTAQRQQAEQHGQPETVPRHEKFPLARSIDHLAGSGLS